MTSPAPVAVVEAVCVGAVGEIGAGDTRIRSAFDKTPQPGQITVTSGGLEGDEHVYKDHGGADYADLVYPSEHYVHWQALGLTLPAAAAMGENLTTRGLGETGVCIGDVFEVGSCVIEVTEPRTPCRKLSVRYGRVDMAALMRANGYTGFLCRVLGCGDIAAGDTLRLLRRDPRHLVTVAGTNRILDHTGGGLGAARRLHAVSALGRLARERLARRFSGPAPSGRR